MLSGPVSLTPSPANGRDIQSEGGAAQHLAIQHNTRINKIILTFGN